MESQPTKSSTLLKTVFLEYRLQKLLYDLWESGFQLGTKPEAQSKYCKDVLDQEYPGHLRLCDVSVSEILKFVAENFQLRSEENALR